MDHEDPNLHHYLAIIEIFIGVRQACKLSGTAVQVDVTGPKDWQETHFRLPRVSCGDTNMDETPV